MTARTIWITGAGGLIGSAFVRTAPVLTTNWQARALRREDLDLTDAAAVASLFQQEKPAAIIHCAAQSKPAACQANPPLARQINVEATIRLAELAAEIPFVFFSTDLVFDGRCGNYVENDSVNPLNVYAETKADAERAVRRNPRHTIIRTSLNGGCSPTGDRGFNEEMRRAWASGRTLNLFTDEYRSPTAALITARAVWELLAQEASGVFHVAGTERLSRWEIGRLLATRWPELNASIEAGSLRDYTGPARAPDTTLNCAKAQARLSFRLPGFTEWLRDNPGEPF